MAESDFEEEAALSSTQLSTSAPSSVPPLAGIAADMASMAERLDKLERECQRQNLMWQAKGFERSSPYKAPHGEEKLYDFCTLQAVGFPWSECAPNTSFVDWANMFFPTGDKKGDVIQCIPCI